MADGDEWIVIGKITSAHGVRGEMKLVLFVDDGEFLRALDTIYLSGRGGRQSAKLTGVRFHKGHALLQLEGIDDRTAAETLRNREVEVPLSWLPPLDEDEFYVAEIVGLAVETAAGEPLGQVAQVLFTGANEVYVVQGGPQGEILLPAIESVIQQVDLDARRMVVTLPDGLLE